MGEWKLKLISERGNYFREARVRTGVRSDIGDGISIHFAPFNLRCMGGI